MRQRLYSKITDIYGICVNYYTNHGKKTNPTSREPFPVVLNAKAVQEPINKARMVE